MPAQRHLEKKDCSYPDRPGGPCQADAPKVSPSDRSNAAVRRTQLAQTDLSPDELRTLWCPQIVFKNSTNARLSTAEILLENSCPPLLFPGSRVLNSNCFGDVL